MAEIRIPFGKTEQVLKVADERLKAVLTPSHTVLEGGTQQ